MSSGGFVCIILTGHSEQHLDRYFMHIYAHSIYDRFDVRFRGKNLGFAPYGSVRETSGIIVILNILTRVFLWDKL